MLVVLSLAPSCCQRCRIFSANPVLCSVWFLFPSLAIATPIGFWTLLCKLQELNPCTTYIYIPLVSEEYPIQQINLRSLHLFHHWRCPGLPSPQGEILPLVVCSLGGLTSPGFLRCLLKLRMCSLGINGPWFHLRFILQTTGPRSVFLMFIPFRRKTTVFSRLSTMWCFFYWYQ